MESQISYSAPTCHSVFKNSESLQPTMSLKSSQVRLATSWAMARLKMPSRQQNPSWRKLSRHRPLLLPAWLEKHSFWRMSSFPTQRMFGRRTRTLLPTTSYLLKPQVQEDVKEKLLKEKSKQAKYYNRNTKELPPLQIGEVVQVAPKPRDRERQWCKVTVYLQGCLVCLLSITCQSEFCFLLI